MCIRAALCLWEAVRTDSVLETWKNYKFSAIEKHEDYTAYYFTGSGGSGRGVMKVYEAADGITLSYDVLDMQSCYQNVRITKGFIQINHCREGCYEFEMKDGYIGFIGQGDLSVSDTSSAAFRNTCIPGGKYRGISIVINIAKAQKLLDQRLPEAGIDLTEMSEQLFSQQSVYIIRSKPALEHIFSELYNVDERIRRPYMLLKILEALCFININRCEDQRKLPCFTNEVVKTVKRAYEYINAHFSDDITVGSLAEQHHISKTNLCSCFKCMYGQPIGSYIRSRRIRYAAELLADQTDLSVGDVAHLVGYDNQSKFASAFKSVWGYSPLAYRKRMKNNDLEQNKNVLE